MLSRIRDSHSQRFISLINLDQDEKELQIKEGGRELFGGKVFLPGRKAKLLPIGIRLNGLYVRWSTAEITQSNKNGLALRQSAMPERVEVEGNVRIDNDQVRVVSGGQGKTLLEIAPGRGSVWLHPA